MAPYAEDTPASILKRNAKLHAKFDHETQMKESKLDNNHDDVNLLLVGSGRLSLLQEIPDGK